MPLFRRIPGKMATTSVNASNRAQTQTLHGKTGLFINIWTVCYTCIKLYTWN